MKLFKYLIVGNINMKIQKNKSRYHVETDGRKRCLHLCNGVNFWYGGARALIGKWCFISFYTIANNFFNMRGLSEKFNASVYLTSSEEY